MHKNNKTMYYIYHIPTFIHKNKKIGKIGCSEEPAKRVASQGYQNYEILEEHTCIYEASRREQKLQQKWGYPVDRSPYWKSRQQWGANAGTKESRIKAGKIAGRKSVESGHIYRMSTKEGRIKGGKIGGPIGGRIAVKTGQLKEALKKSNEVRSIPVTINGIEYKSISEAVRQTGMTRRNIDKLR